MATLNVFELTSEALKNAKLDESVETKKTSKKKVVKESAKKVSKKFKSFGKIPANKLRLESLTFVKEAEEADDVIDYTPEEDVVLVIDPDMEETPETEEEAEEAAEELIGDYVCKCSICGANYVCDCEDINEDLEVEESECPVCGETGEQIVVGEIAPVEGADEDESEDEESEEDTDEDTDADVDVDVDVDVDGDDDDFDFDEEEFADVEDDDDEYEESISRAKRRTAMRRESAMRRNRKPMRKESRRPVRRSAKNESRVLPRRSAKKSSVIKEYNFDETTLNRMLTSFAKENFDNARFVKITKANCKNGRLTLEGTVVTTKGIKRSTKFVAENFTPKAVTSAKFREIGCFTESAISRTPQFTINFKTVGNVIKPAALKYDYVVKEGRDKLQVTGRVMNESVNRKPARRGRRTK
jgi:hypothetical protein